MQIHRPWSIAIGIAGAVGLLILVAIAWDPPVQVVKTHAGFLAEPLARGRHSAGSTPVRVRLAAGRVVVAQASSELYGSPAGQPVQVQEFRTLVFRRPSFVAVRLSQ